MKTLGSFTYNQNLNKKNTKYPLAYQWLSLQIKQIVENLEAFAAIDCSKIIEEITRIRLVHHKEIEELAERFEDKVSHLTLSFEFDYESETVELDFGDWSPLEEIEFDEDASEITDLLEAMFETYKENLLQDSYIFHDEGKLEELFEAKKSEVNDLYNLGIEEYELDDYSNRDLLWKMFKQYLADTTIEEASLDDEMLEFLQDELKEEHMGDIEKAFEEARDEEIENLREEREELFIDFVSEIKEFILKNFVYDSNVNEQQLSSMLDLINDIVEDDNPVEEYLDNIEKELERGFESLGQSLLRVNKDTLISSVDEIFEDASLDFYFARFEEAEKSLNYLETQRTRVLLISAANKVIISKIPNFSLHDYVTDYQSYSSSLFIDLEENGDLIRREAKKFVVGKNSAIELDLKEEKSNIENFYKIFPVHSSARTLSYTSVKNPSKAGPIAFELGPVFYSMRQKGKIAHAVLTKHIHVAKIEKLQKKIYSDNAKVTLNQEKVQIVISNIEKLEALSIRSKAEEKSLRNYSKDRVKLESSIEKSLRSIAEDNAKLLKLIESCREIDAILANPSIDGSILGDATNIFLPSFVFLVETKVLMNPKKFFRVDFKPDWLPYFISTDQHDGIYHLHHEQVEQAKNEELKFFDAIGERASLYNWETIKEIEEKYTENVEQVLNALRKVTGHSERVLTQALRNPRIVEHLVEELRKVMIDEGYSFIDKSYKVYSITLLGHSSKVVCHQCTRALVAQQASYEEGTFLQLLTYEINKENSGFWAYEHGLIKGGNSEKKQGIRCSTIIISGEHYHEIQLEAVRKFPSAEIEFADNTINIKNSNPLAIIELYNPILITPVESRAMESKLTLSCSLVDKLDIPDSEVDSTKKEELYSDFQNKYASRCAGGLLCIIASDDPANEKAFERFGNSLMIIGKDFSESHRKILAIEYYTSSGYSIDYSALAFSAQQGFRFLPTITYFFNILGVDLPNVNLSPEVKASIDLALGMVKINVKSLEYSLILGQVIESGSYFAGLKTVEILNKRPISQHPTDLASLFKVCIPEISNGLVAGISLMSPTHTLHGFISGAAQCLSKHQLFKEETTLQTNARIISNSLVGITSFCITPGNILTKILGMMSNVVASDIATKTIFSIADIGLNGLSSDYILDHYS